MTFSAVTRDEYIQTLAREKPRYASYNDAEFVKGQTPVYYSGPVFDHRELEYALKALLTGKWLVAGEYVHKFQIRFSEMFHVQSSLMVNSGSSANLVMLAALKKYLNWPSDSEIIVSPVGFPTTIAPVVQNNMKPVFADVEMSTLNFDLDEVRKKISDKTKAIFVSPVLGNPPDMDQLQQMCEENNLMLIGDHCDSLGSRWREKLLNEYYFSWSCSFYPAHHITTGEGGMVCCTEEELFKIAQSMAWWGRDCYCVGAANLLSCGTCGNRFDKWLKDYDGLVDHKYVFTHMGYNLKPLDIQGAIGLAQLEKFGEIERKRRQNKKRIEELLRRYVPEVRVAESHGHADPSWFGVPIICDSQEIKEKLQGHFETHKIQTRNYFAGNILIHPGYSHLDDFRKYPNANKTLGHVFFVGCSPSYSESILNYFEEVLMQWTA